MHKHNTQKWLSHDDKRKKMKTACYVLTTTFYGMATSNVYQSWLRKYQYGLSQVSARIYVWVKRKTPSRVHDFVYVYMCVISTRVHTFMQIKWKQFFTRWVCGSLSIQFRGPDRDSFAYIVYLILRYGKVITSRSFRGLQLRIHVICVCR